MTSSVAEWLRTTTKPTFPRTRYQGSKRKLAELIVESVRDLNFHTVLDAFGGTGSIAYAFKAAGKAVTHNDILMFNHQIGLALIENGSITLTLDNSPKTLTPIQAASTKAADAKTSDASKLLAENHTTMIGQPRPETRYDDFIERTFEDIYFTTAENRWLDVAVQNVHAMTCRTRRALAWFAIGQAAIAKRPYNLFHRRNLYMRTAKVSRGFGNKTSWDRSFPEHIETFAREANEAVFDSGSVCQATCTDMMAVEPGFDLVYLDPPYINSKGTAVDYHAFYHFLEGMLQYDDWPSLIDRTSKHRRLKKVDNPWCDSKRNLDQFRFAIRRFSDSIIVLSYRDNGTPTVDELAAIVRSVKTHVRVTPLQTRPYALSTSKRSHEMLIVGY